MSTLLASETIILNPNEEMELWALMREIDEDGVNYTVTKKAKGVLQLKRTN